MDNELQDVLDYIELVAGFEEIETIRHRLTAKHSYLTTQSHKPFEPGQMVMWKDGNNDNLQNRVGVIRDILLKQDYIVTRDLETDRIWHLSPSSVEHIDDIE